MIARAASVLRCLKDEPTGLSLGELAARVGLPRSTVQRIVAALVTEQLLTAASATARVKLGPALVQLAGAANLGAEAVARPLMQELCAAADETVDLSVLRGGAAVFVEQIQGSQRLAAVSAVGKEFPLHCTANGKALLALLAPQRRDQLLAGVRGKMSNAKSPERKALCLELRRFESSGVAYDIEEHSPGICAVGTAFRDSLGREYSLSIPAPTGRFAAKRQRLTKLLLNARKELLRRLGQYRP